MDRSTLAASGVVLRPAICAAALVVVIVTPVHTQQLSSACELLQVADLESAIGGKALKKPAGERQTVPGMTMDTCTAEIARTGQGGVHVVAIHAITDLPVDGGQAILARNTGTAREPQWKVDGAVLEQKTIGTAVCIRYGRPSVPGHSTCSIPRGKGYIEVDVRAGSVQQLVSLEIVAALTQKAAAKR